MTALTQIPGDVVVDDGSTLTRVTAGTAVEAGMPVYLDTATGRYKPCRADTLETSLCAGIAVNSAANGQPLSIVGREATNVDLGATLEPGVTYAVSPAVAGKIVPIVDLGIDNYPAILGTATSPTTLLLDIATPRTALSVDYGGLGGTPSGTIDAEVTLGLTPIDLSDSSSYSEATGDMNVSLLNAAFALADIPDETGNPYAFILPNKAYAIGGEPIVIPGGVTFGKAGGYYNTNPEALRIGHALSDNYINGPSLIRVVQSDEPMIILTGFGNTLDINLIGALWMSESPFVFLDGGAVYRGGYTGDLNQSWHGYRAGCGVDIQRQDGIGRNNGHHTIAGTFSFCEIGIKMSWLGALPDHSDICSFPRLDFNQCLKGVHIEDEQSICHLFGQFYYAASSHGVPVEVYSTGTISCTDGVVTGSGTVFPANSASRVLFVNNVGYSVASRGSDTSLTLDNNVIDFAPGTTYSLDRLDYNQDICIDIRQGGKLLIENMIMVGPGLLFNTAEIDANTGSITVVNLGGDTQCFNQPNQDSSPRTYRLLHMEQDSDLKFCILGGQFSWAAAVSGTHPDGLFEQWYNLDDSELITGDAGIAHLVADINVAGLSYKDFAKWAPKKNSEFSTTRTIDATGHIKMSSNWMKVETYAAAGTDDLTHIDGCAEGQTIILQAASSGRTVVVKSAAATLTNLISAWNMDESGISPNLNRLDSHSTNHLVPTSIVLSESGKIASGAAFVSAGQFLSVPSNAALQTGDIDWSLSFWMKITNLPAGRHMSVVSKSNGTDFEYQAYVSHTDSKLKFSIYGAAANAESDTCSSNAVLVPGEWHHYWLWHDQGAQIGMWIDGVAQTPVAHTTGTYLGTGAFNVGDAFGGTYLEAVLDELSFWKKVPTTQEVTDMYGLLGVGNSYPFVAGGNMLLDGSVDFSLDSSADTIELFNAGSYLVERGGRCNNLA